MVVIIEKNSHSKNQPRDSGNQRNNHFVVHQSKMQPSANHFNFIYILLESLIWFCDVWSSENHSCIKFAKLLVWNTFCYENRQIAAKPQWIWRVFFKFEYCLKNSLYWSKTKSIWRVIFKIPKLPKKSSNCSIHKLNGTKANQFDELFLNSNIARKTRQIEAKPSRFDELIFKFKNHLKNRQTVWSKINAICLLNEKLLITL